MQGVSEQLEKANASVVDVDLPLTQRPLTGGDVQALRASHGLTTYELVVALALASPQALKDLMAADSAPLSIAQEMLLRLYLISPNFPKWGEVTPLHAFEVMYGPCLAPFVGTDLEMAAERRLSVRFAAGLDRTSYATYRWLFLSQGQSKPKPVVTKFLQKVMEQPDPRGTFERLATLTYKVRGVDFEKAFPLVDKDHPPVRRRPGPRVKKTGSAVKVAPLRGEATAPAAPAPKKPRASKKTTSPNASKTSTTTTRKKKTG